MSDTPLPPIPTPDGLVLRVGRYRVLVDTAGEDLGSDGLELLAAIAVLFDDWAPLGGPELRFCRRAHGASTLELGAMLDVGEATVVAWENDEFPIDRHARLAFIEILVNLRWARDVINAHARIIWPEPSSPAKARVSSALAGLRRCVASGDMEGAKVYQDEAIKRLGELPVKLEFVTARRWLLERAPGNLRPTFLDDVESLVFGATPAQTPRDSLAARIGAAIALLDRDLPEWDDGWGWTAKQALEALRGGKDAHHLSSLGGAQALLAAVDPATIPESVQEPFTRARRAVGEAIVASLRASQTPPAEPSP